MDFTIKSDTYLNLQSEMSMADGLVARIAALLTGTSGRIVLTTSFGLEDQVLTQAAVSAMALTGRTIEFATLDTGRLFPETIDVWAETERVYDVQIACLTPDGSTLANLVKAQGVMGFRQSADNRIACCDVRKLAPLRQFLKGADLWITGLRADQSAARAATAFIVHDMGFGVLKAQPLADWSRDDVVDYAEENNVPVNVLHDRGFLSIGCAPCTRAVAPGESERAGRWWWEDEGHKECGLHRRDIQTLPAPVLETLA